MCPCAWPCKSSVSLWFKPWAKDGHPVQPPPWCKSGVLTAVQHSDTAHLLNTINKKKQKTCHPDRSCGSTAWLQYSCVKPSFVSAMSWWKSWRWKGEHEFDCWGVCDVAGGKWGLGGSFNSLYIAQGQNLLRNIIFVFRGFYAFYTKDSRIEVCLKLMRQE